MLGAVAAGDDDDVGLRVVEHRPAAVVDLQRADELEPAVLRQRRLDELAVELGVQRDHRADGHGAHRGTCAVGPAGIAGASIRTVCIVTSWSWLSCAPTPGRSVSHTLPLSAAKATLGAAATGTRRMTLPSAFAPRPLSPP